MSHPNAELFQLVAAHVNREALFAIDGAADPQVVVLLPHECPQDPSFDAIDALLGGELRLWQDTGSVQTAEALVAEARRRGLRVARAQVAVARAIVDVNRELKVSTSGELLERGAISQRFGGTPELVQAISALYLKAMAQIAELVRRPGVRAVLSCHSYGAVGSTPDMQAGRTAELRPMTSLVCGAPWHFADVPGLRQHLPRGLRYLPWPAEAAILRQLDARGVEPGPDPYRAVSRWPWTIEARIRADQFLQAAEKLGLAPAGIAQWAWQGNPDDGAPLGPDALQPLRQALCNYDDWDAVRRMHALCNDKLCGGYELSQGNLDRAADLGTALGAGLADWLQA